MSEAPLRIAVGDVDVAYRRQGSGPPMLFLHGGGLTRRALPLHAALAARGYDLIAPEHPGFGDTRRPRWYRTLDDVVLHYADLLTALDAPSAHVVGHSIGGLLAGSIAAVFPERVASLTLIAPAPLPVVSPPLDLDVPEPEPGGEPFDFDEILFNGHQAAYPDYRAGDDEGDLLAEHDDDLHADPEAWDPWGAPSLHRRLGRVTCPAQVLVPDEDRLFAPDIARAWATSLGCDLATVPGDAVPTSHLLIVQEPERIADAAAALARRAC